MIRKALLHFELTLIAIIGTIAGVSPASPAVALHSSSLQDNKIVIPPEYTPVSTVAVTGTLLSSGYDVSDLIKTVLDSGAKILIATNGSQDRQAVEQTLQRLHLRKAEKLQIEIVAIPYGNIWLRDYGPIIGVTNERDGRHLRFFDFKYESSAKSDDAFPSTFGALVGQGVTQMPLYLDGGNFLSAGRTCITSTADVAATDETANAWQELKHPGVVTLKNLYSRALGCEKLIVIENPPHEHVDMWLKVIGPNSVLVNELEDKSLAAFKNQFGYVPSEFLELQSLLNKQAQELAAVFHVERIPMPLPYRNVFRNYVNSILVNGIAVVPSFARFGWNYDDYPDASLKTYYERKVERIYQRHGLKVRFVNADSLIYNGGAFHCVALQIPKVLKDPVKAKGL